MILTQFQQQVVREVLLEHRMDNDSFCSGYEKAGCKYRIPFGSAPKMREAHAQHQVEMINEALKDTITPQENV
jgi:hypothetical protein